MIQAIVFDFDGLILDTETPIFQAWQRVYADLSCNLTLEEYSECVGGTHQHFDPFADLARKCGRTVLREEIQPRVSQICNEMILRQDLLPGIREIVSAARESGLRMAVASSSTRSWVEGHLSRLELRPFFQAVRTRDDVPRLKPEPDLYLSALEALGVEAGRAFALEDSPHGVLAARRAGLFAVAIPNGLTRHLYLNEPDLLLDSLADMPLPVLLQRIQEQRTLSP